MKNFLIAGAVNFENKMKLAQTNLSKLRRSEIFVENPSAQDSKLRRSGIFRRRAEDVAPTELKSPIIASATNMSRLRRCEIARLNSGSTRVPRVLVNVPFASRTALEKQYYLVARTANVRRETRALPNNCVSEHCAAEI
jgi:hypothetical protein